MMPYVLVALGGAIGSLARYAMTLLSVRLWGITFPWGTVLINVLGSFVIGFFAALTSIEGPLPAGPGLRVFVMVGICGGFTTFSSFSLQTLDLLRGADWLGAVLNIVLSVAFCLLAVTLGQVMASRLGIGAALGR
jgi:CrcB protein